MGWNSCLSSWVKECEADDAKRSETTDDGCGSAKRASSVSARRSSPRHPSARHLRIDVQEMTERDTDLHDVPFKSNPQPTLPLGVHFR